MCDGCLCLQWHKHCAALYCVFELLLTTVIVILVYARIREYGVMLLAEDSSRCIHWSLTQQTGKGCYRALLQY